MRPFRELSHLPPDERREALMVRLEHVWDEAQARTYTNKRGAEVPAPDTAVMLKVVQAVAVLQGMTGEPNRSDAERLERMTDAELVREATKRLPAAQVAELADTLIELREQQKLTIETTGETTDATQEKRRVRRKQRPQGNEPSAPKPGPKWA
jgi:hypothetical protein